MRAIGGGRGVPRRRPDRYDLAPVAAAHPRPLPARPGRCTAAPTRVVVAVLALALAVVVGAGPASARAAQDPGVTATFEVATTTTTLAGSSTTVPATAGVTTTAAGGDGAPDVGAGSKRVADENRKIWAVVAGLVLVALALSVLTIRYWRRTRPVPIEVRPMQPTEAALAVALTSTPTEGEGSAVAPEAEGSEEPVADAPVGDAPVVESAEPVETVETAEAVEDDEPVVPAAWAPAAAAVVDDPLDDPADDTAPVPVVDAPEAEPGTARRAVAGADHAGADEAWEPRGTGEHERVVVASTARPNRLTAEQRAALFAQRPPRDP